MIWQQQPNTDREICRCGSYGLYLIEYATNREGRKFYNAYHVTGPDVPRTHLEGSYDKGIVERKCETHLRRLEASLQTIKQSATR